MGEGKTQEKCKHFRRVEVTWGFTDTVFGFSSGSDEQKTKNGLLKQMVWMCVCVYCLQ